MYEEVLSMFSLVSVLLQAMFSSWQQWQVTDWLHARECTRPVYEFPGRENRCSVDWGPVSPETVTFSRHSPLGVRRQGRSASRDIFLKHDEEDVISVKLQDFIKVAASHWCIAVWLTVMDASIVGEKALTGSGLPLAQLSSLVCTLEWPSVFFCFKTRHIANRVLSWHEITDRAETGWRIVLLPKTLRHPAAQWKASAVRRRHISHVWSAVCLRKGELQWVFSCWQTVTLWDFSVWPRSINSWMLILCLWRVLN